MFAALMAGASLLFMAFVVSRAIQVPLTYDEAAAYLTYISTDLLSVFTFVFATNHLLQTLLSRVAHMVGGDSELALRMPTLIGYGLYLWFSFRILHGLTRRAIAWAGFMLLNLNPYLLEYFALSRGYGLSLGLLMGALFFLFRFLSQARTTDANRHLSRSLLLAGGAVMANFAFLNLYLAIFAIGLVALLVLPAPAAGSSAPGEADSPFPIRAGSSRWLPLVATVFTLLVFSQDLGLSETLYEPVTVRVDVLLEADRDAVSVYQIDDRGRRTLLRRDAGEWRLDRPAHVCGLLVEMPAGAARHLASIDVTLGGRSFRHEQNTGGFWTSHDDGGTRVMDSASSLSLPKSRVPAFRRVINWGGDSRYAVVLAAHTALALSALSALALLFWAAGRPAVRAHALTRERWRLLASSALWLATLAGSPLYLLIRNGALFYGGHQGLVRDTFYSIIESSFHGRTYHPAQVPIAFVCSVATLVALGIALCVRFRRNGARVLPGASLLAILVVVSMAIVGQRAMFDTPYPRGRTAIFFIPLFALAVVFLFDAVAELGRRARVLAVAVLALMVVLSASHFVAVANASFAWDWPRDAATRMMMADLEQVITREQSPRAQVVLGVDSKYYAAAVFYARRSRAAAIDVKVVPSAQAVDFVYVDDRSRDLPLHIIRKYPVAGSVLAEPDTPR